MLTLIVCVCGGGLKQLWPGQRLQCQGQWPLTPSKPLNRGSNARGHAIVVTLNFWNCDYINTCTFKTWKVNEQTYFIRSINKHKRFIRWWQHVERICLFLSGQGFDEGNWPLVDQPKRRNKTIRTQRICLNASLVLFFYVCVCFMLYEKRRHFPQIERTLVCHHFFKKKSKGKILSCSFHISVFNFCF